ncbi:hypothetical protein BZA77DRAFT_296144 [Pyronema omphalodes]|nr:hypothetical protein BZA77DRAFT_296144 [Pyronema omphalodes]
MDETDNLFPVAKWLTKSGLAFEARQQSAELQSHAGIISAIQQQAQDTLEESLVAPPAEKPPTSRFSSEDLPRNYEPNSSPFGYALRETTSPYSTLALEEQNDKPIPRLFVPLKQWPAEDLENFCSSLDAGYELDEHILDDNILSNRPSPENTLNDLDGNPTLVAYKNTQAPRGTNFLRYSTVAAILLGRAAPPKEDKHPEEANAALPVVEDPAQKSPITQAFRLDDEEGYVIESNGVNE